MLVGTAELQEPIKYKIIQKTDKVKAFFYLKKEKS